MTAAGGCPKQHRRAAGYASRWAMSAVAALEDVGLVLLVVLLCPLAILIVGAPAVLLVRLLIEIAERL